MTPVLFPTLVLAASLFLATAKGVWQGSVTLYDGANFLGSNYLFHVSETQTCYNVDACFGDRATSIKWTGLPHNGTLNGDAWIFFYEKPDCNKPVAGDWPNAPRGKVRGWKVSEPYPPQDLGFDGMDNAISSFMIWESSGTPVLYRDACYHA